MQYCLVTCNPVFVVLIILSKTRLGSIMWVAYWILVSAPTPALGTYRVIELNGTNGLRALGVLGLRVWAQGRA